MSEPNKGNNPEIDADKQKALLTEAKVAGAAGDEKAMLRPLIASHLIDGLHQRLARKLVVRYGRDCDDDDVDTAIEQAVAALFTALNSGDEIRDLGAFLYRVAERRAIDLHRQRRSQVRLNPEVTGDGGDASVMHKLSREEDERAGQCDPEVLAEKRRREGVQTVRRLLPEMRLARSQEVIGYILDVMEGESASKRSVHRRWEGHRVAKLHIDVS